MEKIFLRSYIFDVKIRPHLYTSSPFYGERFTLKGTEGDGDPSGITSSQSK
jgi:hypothetical protein